MLIWSYDVNMIIAWASTYNKNCWIIDNHNLPITKSVQMILKSTPEEIHKTLLFDFIIKMFSHQMERSHELITSLPESLASLQWNRQKKDKREFPLVPSHFKSRAALKPTFVHWADGLKALQLKLRKFPCADRALSQHRNEPGGQSAFGLLALRNLPAWLLGQTFCFDKPEQRLLISNRHKKLLTGLKRAIPHWNTIALIKVQKVPVVLFWLTGNNTQYTLCIPQTTDIIKHYGAHICI